MWCRSRRFARRKVAVKQVQRDGIPGRRGTAADSSPKRVQNERSVAASTSWRAVFSRPRSFSGGGRMRWVALVDSDLSGGGGCLQPAWRSHKRSLLSSRVARAGANLWPLRGLVCKQTRPPGSAIRTHAAWSDHLWSDAAGTGSRSLTDREISTGSPHLPANGAAMRPEELVSAGRLSYLRHTGCDQTMSPCE